MTAAFSSSLSIVKNFSLIGHNLDFPKTNLHLISSFVITRKNETATDEQLQLHKQLMMHQQTRVTQWIVLLKV